MNYAESNLPNLFFSLPFIVFVCLLVKCCGKDKGKNVAHSPSECHFDEFCIIVHVSLLYFLRNGHFFTLWYDE